MRLALPGGLVLVMLAVLAMLAPDETWGRSFRRRCRRCQRMAEICVCPTPCPPVVDACPPACPTTVVCPPVTSTQTCLKAVTETCYVQKPVVTKRCVKETCYRNEQYCETVPTTVCENITVDEGCYKMVWCPKLVTRQVPKTVMTQRLATRAVPYLVDKEITECVTQTVPVQRVRYIPETKTVSCVTRISQMPPVPVTCAAPVQPHCAAPLSPAATTPTHAPEPPADTNSTGPEPTGPATLQQTIPEPMSATPNEARPTPVEPRSQSARPASSRRQVTTTVSPSAANVWRTRPGQ